MQRVKPKSCKVCKKVFTPRFSTTQVCCDIKCAIKHAEKKNAELEVKRKRLEKKQTREAWLALQPKSYWFKEAQTWFNKFIRMRDADKECISSSTTRRCSRQRHAGHYRSVGSAPHLRFDERNCHGQCAQCNDIFSGNLIEYRKNLIERIGQRSVDELEADNEARNYTIPDLKEMIKHYKQKCKELEA